MKRALLAAAAAGLAASPAAADVTRAAKVTCVPDSVTRCSNGRCTTRAATPRDKADILVVDFSARKASIRRGNEVKPFADIGEVKQGPDERRFVLTEPGDPGGERLEATLSKGGRLTIAIGADGGKGEAICTIGS